MTQIQIIAVVIAGLAVGFVVLRQLSGVLGGIVSAKKDNRAAGFQHVLDLRAILTDLGHTPGRIDAMTLHDVPGCLACEGPHDKAS